MPRPSLGPRLYWDNTRQSWVIRDGQKFVRTGAVTEEEARKVFLGYEPHPDPMGKTKVPTSGFVYFITAADPGFPIKIGFMKKRTDLRLRTLQTGCPYPLFLVGTVPGTYRDERTLHRRFSAQRLSGEWFERTPELLAHIKGACDNATELAA